MLKGGRAGEVARQRPDRVRHQIHDQSFSDHRHPGRAPAQIGEEAAAPVLVRQVEAHPFELAHRRRAAENLFLVVEDVG